jgi:hypothetical protein
MPWLNVGRDTGNGVIASAFTAMGDKTGKDESVRRKVVALRLRDFFAALLSQLRESNESFWRRVDEKSQTTQPKQPDQK